ncbi:class I SAM-dependent methyltransferase [Amorphus sp. 3PC139-8]|uniref:class I SAM-dependent methyltransferase n=1 Tax=Amorphus sp. 3PC139-8 TaxID=2735676 RepID=UPI00345CA6F6
MTTPLAREIAAEIAADGPISIARYMARCLGDPRHGYYTTRIPFGQDGDFVTAPEVSQVFGELIGAWLIAAWEDQGAPSPVRLVELGPGRGTLMADILRVARLRPGFLQATHVDLVETSPRLRDAQRDRLADAPCPITWHERIEEVPGGPAFVVANEFFDALPIRQFMRTETDWHERVIGLDDTGALAFGLGPARLDDAALTGLPSAQPGTILERQPIADAIMATLATRIATEGGALLAIDYGYLRPGFGDTLQAVKSHAYAPVLETPGEADLTAHVNFAALAGAAECSGAVAHGPMTQAAFLLALGLVERAQKLAAGKDDTAFATLEAALNRLAGAEEMGELFKVLAVTSPGIRPPPF